MEGRLIINTININPTYFQLHDSCGAPDRPRLDNSQFTP